MASTLTTAARRAASQQWQRPQVRGLHMTLPAPGPSTWLGADLKQRRYLPRAVTELKAECKQRRLSVSESKTELADRLARDDLAHFRGYSTSTSKRPSTGRSSTTSASSPAQTRPFNTTRALKAPKDTSTMDFAFLPDMPQYTNPPRSANFRTPNFSSPSPPSFLAQPTSDRRQQEESFIVPLLPPSNPSSITSPSPATQHLDSPAPTFTHPEISTVAALSTHLHAPSAMSDVLDNAAIAFDPFELPAKVSAAASQLGVKGQEVGAAAAELGIRGQQVVREETGAVRKVWEGLVEDVFGGAGGVAAAAAAPAPSGSGGGRDVKA
ncbi:MAG: hypothetical protein M1837_000426 [Sclerophora amabilis]|nr:MAG: hypothetical protein M1837_000426 [Sclerophora amabilis]